MVDNKTEEVLHIMANKYKKAAIYHTDSDCIEYVRFDGSVFYERIDDFLTLVKDLETKETVGFKMKGFKYFFRNHSDAFCKTDDHFCEVICAFEVILTTCGDDLLGDPDIQKAYDEAVALASNDNVKIESGELEMLRAA